LEKSEIIIENYSTENIDEVINVLELSFGHSFQKQRWMWLHHENLLSPSSIILAKSKGKMVGIYSVIKKELIIEGQLCIGGRDIDPVVHPDFRGQGIFTKLLKAGQERFKDIDVFFNFANSKSMPGFVKNGWQVLPNYKLFVPAIPILKSIYRFVFLYLNTHNIVTPKLDIIPMNSFVDFNIIENKIQNEKSVYVKKNRDYLEWRFNQNPSKEYCFFKATSGNNDLCLYVCSIEGKKTFLIDIINQSDYSKSQLLKRFILFYLNNPTSYILTTWSTICEYSDSLMIKGKKGYFLVKGKGDFSSTVIFNSENWDMGPGESEFK
jgi:hypothetical protein